MPKLDYQVTSSGLPLPTIVRYVAKFGATDHCRRTKRAPFVAVERHGYLSCVTLGLAFRRRPGAGKRRNGGMNISVRAICDGSATRPELLREYMRSLELADIALAVATTILMFVLVLASMPGWH